MQQPTVNLKIKHFFFKLKSQIFFENRYANERQYILRFEESPMHHGHAQTTFQTLRYHAL